MLYYILGGAIASFVSTQINAWLYNKNNFLRSSCWECNHTLNFVDLIPTFGYLIRKGKCHYCGNPINVRYLYYEIVYGILAVRGMDDLGDMFISITICAMATVAYECYHQKRSE